MSYLRKPVSCLESLVHLSKVNICVNEHVSDIRMTSPCVIEYRWDSQIAYLCYSGGMFWCKLWLRLWSTLQILSYTLLCTEIDCKRLDKIQIYAITICTVICWQTMSLRYRKKKTALCSTKKKTSRNVNIGQSP